MVAHIFAGVVGVVIAIAGAMKVVNSSQWQKDARAQNLWPVVYYLLPYIELLLGASLIVLNPSVYVLGLSTLLLLIFTVFLVAQIASKSTVPCACFGPRSRRAPSSRDVLRNLGLMALLFISAALS